MPLVAVNWRLYASGAGRGLMAGMVLRGLGRRPKRLLKAAPLPARLLQNHLSQRPILAEVAKPMAGGHNRSPATPATLDFSGLPIISRDHPGFPGFLRDHVSGNIQTALKLAERGAVHLLAR